MAVEEGATGVISLAIGLSSALATVVVAVVNGRNSRRDARENIKRDVELAKQMQDGSQAKEILENFISFQIQRLAVNSATQAERFALFLAFAITQSSLVTLLAITIASQDPRQIHTTLVLIAAVGAVSLIITGEVLVRTREVARTHLYNLDFDLHRVPPIGISIRKLLSRAGNMLKIDNIKAAWNALHSDTKPSANQDQDRPIDK